MRDATTHAANTGTDDAADAADRKAVEQEQAAIKDFVKG